MNGRKITEAMRLAFNKCPQCGDRSLIYGHWLRWCGHRECGWYGPQRIKEMTARSD